MPLRDNLAVKYDLYTLACRELLDRLTDLERAILRSRSSLSCEKCLNHYDSRFEAFFSLDMGTSKSTAASRLGDEMSMLAKYFNNIQGMEEVAKIFTEIADKIVDTDHLSSWGHMNDLARHHKQGCDLARNFFAESPWEVTKTRLGHQCEIDIFLDANNTWPSAICKTPENPREIHLHFHPSHGFEQYLAYAWFYLHEYTAHVYAMDNGNNPQFHDGWMIFACKEFLKFARKQAIRSSSRFDLHHRQAQIRESLLINENNRPAYEGYQLAEEFMSSFESLDIFMEITFGLAAFQPQSEEEAHWLTRFLNSLRYELKSNPEGLLDKLQRTKGKGVRALMGILTPI